MSGCGRKYNLYPMLEPDGLNVNNAAAAVQPLNTSGER
jgi:hypothetical protein